MSSGDDDDVDDFWSNSLLVMILFFWMIIITVVVIIFALCWCFTLYTRRRQRHQEERERYYREQTLLDYNSKPEIQVNVSKLPLDAMTPITTPSSLPPPPTPLVDAVSPSVVDDVISEPPPPDWLNTMKADDYTDFQFDTITRSGKPVAPPSSTKNYHQGEYEYETRSLPRSVPNNLNHHNRNGSYHGNGTMPSSQFAYDNVGVVMVGEGGVGVVHHSHPNLVYE